MIFSELSVTWYAYAMKKIALLAVLGVVLVGCSNQTIRDLEDVPVQEPDKSEIYTNVDKFPNINRICIDGVAFATTTRDYEPIIRVPEWDQSWCAE